MDIRFIFPHLCGYWNQVLSEPCQCTENTHKNLCVSVWGVLCYTKADWFMRRVEFGNGGGDLIGGWWQGLLVCSGCLLSLRTGEGKRGRGKQYFTTLRGGGRAWKVPVTHGVHCFNRKKSKMCLVGVLKGRMRSVKMCDTNGFCNIADSWFLSHHCTVEQEVSLWEKWLT